MKDINRQKRKLCCQNQKRRNLKPSKNVRTHFPIMFTIPKSKSHPPDSAKESRTEHSEPRPRPTMQQENTIPSVKQNQVTTGLRPAVYEIRTRVVDHSARTNWEEDKPDRSITALCQDREWETRAHIESGHLK